MPPTDEDTFRCVECRAEVPAAQAAPDDEGLCRPCAEELDRRIRPAGGFRYR